MLSSLYVSSYIIPTGLLSSPSHRSGNWGFRELSHLPKSTKRGSFRLFWQRSPIFSSPHYHSFIHSCSEHLFRVCQRRALLKPWDSKVNRVSPLFRTLQCAGRDRHDILAMWWMLCQGQHGRVVNMGSGKTLPGLESRVPLSLCGFEQVTYHLCASDALYVKWRRKQYLL